MPTILMVVDDEPDVQLLMKQKFRKQLRNHEYEFIFAANGSEALEKLKDNPNIDVILCDVNMPEMDGITLLSKTKVVNPTVQTVIVSAYGDMRNIRRAMNNGAFDFVTKPINFNDLGATIAKTIKHVQRLKESITEKEQLHQKLERYSRDLEKTIEERTNEITVQKEIIEAKNQSITESINYAKRIQDAALPRVEEIKESIPKSFIYFKPRDIVSGDFYWFVKEGNKIIVTAADCTGHGVPGAFMSLIGNDLLNEIVSARGVIESDKILNELHDSVRKALRQEENRSRDGMDLALCVIDTENKKLQFSGAKNPLVYFKNGEMTVIKGDKYPIGGVQFQLDRHYTRHEVDLSEPIMLYIFSDGYQDQFGGEKSEKFMSKNFKLLLKEIHEKPVEEQKQILDEKFKAWKGERSQIDDILVMGMRF
ncbi:response regulator [Bernardetia sp. OM2101]|uniref:response regulator n=1 Tax=Bernardetia sp. OM2101 TaxID=3344876 RepID=UPI0035D0B9FD